jgi:hypothetical protein
MEATHEPKYGTVKDYGHTYKFYLNNCFPWRAFLIWRYWDFHVTEVDEKLAPVNEGPFNKTTYAKN